MPDWIAIIILGVSEGVTEFLPISSTAHLLIAEHWLPRQSDLFNIVIQSGAVIAVIPLFPEPHVSHFLKRSLAIFSVPCHWYPDRMLAVLDPIFVKTVG